MIRGLGLWVPGSRSRRLRAGRLAGMTATAPHSRFASAPRNDGSSTRHEPEGLAAGGKRTQHGAEIIRLLAGRNRMHVAPATSKRHGVLPKWKRIEAVGRLVDLFQGDGSIHPLAHRDMDIGLIAAFADVPQVKVECQGIAELQMLVVLKDPFLISILRTAIRS